MSNFNVDNLLNQTLNVDDVEKTFTPIPEGEHPIQLSKLELVSGDIKKGDRAGQKWYALKLKCTITDPNVAMEMGLPEASRTHQMFLDIEDGEVATGTNKNIALGQLFDAVGLSGESSLAELDGLECIALFKHVMTEDDRPRADIVGFAAL